MAYPTLTRLGGNGSSGSVQLPATVRSVGQSVLPPVVANLERQLRVNQQRYGELDSYYRGDHPHTFDSLRFQQAFGKQLRRFADNWMKLVVNVTVNRLRIEGFRVGDTEDTSAPDQAAWSIWKQNRLRRSSRMAHRDALKYGTSFLLVDPFDSQGNRLDGRPPRITVESPLQVVGQHDASDRTVLVNAIKKWIDVDGYLYLNFYTPAYVLKFRSSGPAQRVLPDDQQALTEQVNWVQTAEVDNPLGEVPIVPVENEPDPILGGMSDLDDLIPLNDGLNKTLRDALVASEYQGFRQRAVMGVDLPKDPQTGKPLTEHMAQLTASEKRVWMFPNPETKIQEFGQIDLTPYTEMVDMWIHHISMVSTTPAYMLVGKMANLSSDAIRAAELGFVGKLEGKQQDFDPSWERGMGMALRAMGSDSADNPIETIWKDAAANSGSVLANELALMVKVGLPVEAALEKYGITPATIARWKAQGLITDAELDDVEPDTGAAAGVTPSSSTARTDLPGAGNAPDD